MPRPNTRRVTLTLPDEWILEAQNISRTMATPRSPALSSRSVLLMALARGLLELRATADRAEMLRNSRRPGVKSDKADRD